MIKMKIFGEEVNVLEHMKEVKEKSNLFGKFYNKKQMFNYFLGKYIFVDNFDKTREEQPVSAFNRRHFMPSFGEASGAYTSIGESDIHIAFYKIEDLDRDADDMVLSSLDWGSFFIKSDDGQIYFVNTEED